MTSPIVMRTTKKRVKRQLLLTFLCAGPIACAPDAVWGTDNSNVVAGAAGIMTTGNTLSVNTLTDRTVINWDGFNVGAANLAEFHQPSSTSAVLNRVITPDNPSAIHGTIQSNGNVYLVNPAGVVVGPSGLIQTNGFIASTLDIANDEFMAGGTLNFRGDSEATIVNQGTIATGQGGASLIGRHLHNDGLITSDGGNVNLIGGGTVNLRDEGIDSQADQSTVVSGLSPTAGLVRNSGTIRATGALEVGGDVYLVNPGGQTIQAAQIAATKTDSEQSTGGHGTLPCFSTPCRRPLIRVLVGSIVWPANRGGGQGSWHCGAAPGGQLTTQESGALERRTCGLGLRPDTGQPD